MVFLRRISLDIQRTKKVISKLSVCVLNTNIKNFLEFTVVKNVYSFDY